MSIRAFCSLLLMTASLPLLAQREDRPFGQASIHATLPVTVGWFNGQPCFYISTDASDADVAAALKANFTPELANAAPNASKVIYAVTNFTQGNIVPSTAMPAGPTNTDRGYSPLWQVSMVTWNAGSTPAILRSESEVLAMQSAGRVTIARTNIVVNCPILYTPQGGVLPGTRISMMSGMKAGSAEATATLPVTVGWFNGQQVLYISTDASDAAAAGAEANLSLPLAMAANTQAVDDIYVVTNFKQGNIIPSAPVPAGARNGSGDYTPLWQVSMVTWNEGVTPRVLRSEADVQAALADGVVSIQKTRIVVNCPVIFSPLGGTLPGVTITASRN
ncbi:MAG: hypothetical protein HY820_41895 [Acidobacteria bacterium]|nr:hypothetical protein [Acidobacteriota bacterium]